MFILITLAIMMAGAWSLPAGDMDGMMMMMGNMTKMPDMTGTMATPMPCCTPPTWQGYLVDLKSQYDVSNKSVKLS
ncbi:hypothetical protein PoB_007418800 [Plakobranchus ocellatus]|uniref:Uncharacterized protein n=1 Tax=Plakobranchus ocellatus TaxID=259542 RepID=A0AAV4DTM4_9GAST|nr:hypothetical protein PoB_007418800 [Plakobranchus ocellatus]